MVPSRVFRSARLFKRVEGLGYLKGFLKGIYKGFLTGTYIRGLVFRFLQRSLYKLSPTLARTL